MPPTVRRKAVVEPVFGQMRLSWPPDNSASATSRAQWRFDCSVHNFLKLQRNGGLTALQAAA